MLFARLVLVCCVLGMFAQQVVYAHTVGENVSFVADPYDEANCIRAGEGYAELGFFANGGLPDLAYGDRFYALGSKHDPTVCARSDRCVYLHNPPAPQVLVGLLTRLLGKGHIFFYRLAPLASGLFAFAFFAWAAARALGDGKAALLVVAMTCVPMARTMMHGLEYHSYALHAAVVEIGALLLMYKHRGPLSRGDACALLLIGLFQGAFSFEYAFVVTFMPVAFWLMRRNRGSRAERVRVVGAVAALGGAFTVAHALHFAQVVMFLGGLSNAISDYAERASYRSAGVTAFGLHAPSVREVFSHYALDALPANRHFGFPVAVAFVATFALLLLFPRRRSAPFTRAFERLDAGFTEITRGRLQLRPGRGYAAAFMLVLALPSVWVGAMRQLAMDHTHFVPREFFVTFVVGGILLLKSVRVRRRAALAPSGALRAQTVARRRSRSAP